MESRVLTLVIGTLTLGFALACTSILNPAGSRYSEAEDLAEAGDFDKAIKTFGEVKAGWPDSPEARMVPKAIEDALVTQITSAIDAQDYEAAAQASEALEKRSEERWRGLDERLNAGVTLGQAKASGTTVLDIFAERARKAGDEQVTNDMHAWACEHSEQFLAGCTAKLDPEAGLPDLHIAITVGKMGCDDAAPLVKWCGDAVSASITKAEDDLEAATTVWAERAGEDVEEVVVEAKALSKPCPSWVRQRDDLNVSLLNNIDRLGTALRLSKQRDAVEAKLRENRDQIEELAKGVATRPWPDEVKEHAKEQLDEEAGRCI